MESNFTKFHHFRGSNPDEDIAFQKQVKEFLGEIYPLDTFSDGKAPLEIVINDLPPINIEKIKAKYLNSSRTKFELKEIIKKEFDELFEGEEEFDKFKELKNDWSEMKPKVFPQFVINSRFANQPVISRPFGADLSICLVVDAKNTYAFPEKKALDAWGVSESEAFEAAFFNMNLLSDRTALEIFEKPVPYIVITPEDGFTAIRILLQGFQQFIGDNLGFPFYFAIPFRDFLICWAKDENVQFQNETRTKIFEMFSTCPNPLTESLFMIEEVGKIVQFPNWNPKKSAT